MKIWRVPLAFVLRHGCCAGGVPCCPGLVLRAVSSLSVLSSPVGGVEFCDVSTGSPWPLVPPTSRRPVSEFVRGAAPPFFATSLQSWLADAPFSLFLYIFPVIFVVVFLPVLPDRGCFVPVLPDHFVCVTGLPALC